MTTQGLQEQKKLPESVKKASLLLISAGVVLMIISFIVDSHRAFYNYILMYSFIVSIGVGSLGLVALEYIVDAAWSTPFRRISEFLAFLIPFLLILAIPIIFGIHDLYHWSHKEALETDPILQGKAPYLNTAFFIIRVFACILIWMLFYFLITKNSEKQDITKEYGLLTKNIKLSIGFAPLLIITLTITAIDLIMSLEPHWYSTMFGVYYFSGTAVAGLAATTLLAVILKEKGYLHPQIQDRLYHSMGTLLFGLNVFWAYIAFSQFLLIWYADIPEETFWMMHRMHGSWGVVSLALFFIHFIIPFIILLPGRAKTNFRTLKIMAIWLLFAHILDLYWLIMPNFNKESAFFSWNEIGFILFIVGFVLFVFKMKSDKTNFTPVGDPKLETGLEVKLYPDLSID